MSSNKKDIKETKMEKTKDQTLKNDKQAISPKDAKGKKDDMLSVGINKTVESKGGEVIGNFKDDTTKEADKKESPTKEDDAKGKTKEEVESKVATTSSEAIKKAEKVQLNKDEMKTVVKDVMQKSEEKDKSDSQPKDTTDKNAIGVYTKDAEQQRNLQFAVGTISQTIMQKDIQDSVPMNDKENEVILNINLDLEGDVYTPTYQGSRRIVEGPPQLLQIISTGSNAIDYDDEYYMDIPKLREVPLIQDSREKFKKGVDVVRVELRTKNTNYDVAHDPTSIIQSDESLFHNVILSSDADTTPLWTTTKKQNIQHVFTAMFNMFPLLIKSCRVIVQLKQPNLKLLLPYTGIDENLCSENKLLIHVGMSKLPPQVGIHITLGAVDHPCPWFKKDITAMLESDQSQFIIGEVGPVRSQRGGDKKTLMINYATDQFAAALYEVDRMRRENTKMSIHSYALWLRMLSLPQTIIEPPWLYQESDYELPSITAADSDSFLFAFLTSKSFQNGVINDIVNYIHKFDLLKSVSLQEAIKTYRPSVSSQAYEALIANIQSKCQTVDTKVVIQMIVYEVLACFVPVRIEPRASLYDDLYSIPDFFMDLFSLLLFRNIARQNLHIIGYNICCFLRNVDNKQFVKFHKDNGFSSASAEIYVISEDDYRNGEIPYIFDESKKVEATNVIGMIRSLLKVSGTPFRLVGHESINLPRFEKQPTAFNPYKRILRQKGEQTNPFYEKCLDIISIIQQVGSQRNKQVQERTSVKTEFIKWVGGMKNMLRNVGATFHFEISMIYEMVFRHFGCVYTDVKTEADYKNPMILRFGVRGHDNEKEQPWIIMRDQRRVKFSLFLSIALTVRGVFDTINSQKIEEVRINMPNPVSEFTYFFSKIKGISEAAEVLGIGRQILRSDTDGFMKELNNIVHLATKRVTYVNVIKGLGKSIKSMPEDFYEFVDQHIQYANKALWFDPSVTQVDDYNDAIEPNQQSPDVCKRHLRFVDEYIEQEMNIVSSLLFSEKSFLFPIRKGILICRNKVTYLYPGNPAPTINALKIDLSRTVQRNIFQPMNIAGRYVSTMRYIDPITKQIVTHEEVEPGSMIRTHFIVPHPRCINERDRDLLIELIIYGDVSIEFTELWYQSRIDYTNMASDKYPKAELMKIFMTFDDTLPVIYMPDTRQSVNNVATVHIQRQIYQYLYPLQDTNLQNDVLLRSIDGARPNPVIHEKAKKINWMLGKPGPSVKPLFLDGSSKLDCGAPNFLNCLIVEKKDKINRVLPPMKIKILETLFGSGM